MKILQSLYDKDQKPFFDKYQPLIPTLFYLGIIAQIISFTTEISVVYNIVSSKLHSFPVLIDPTTIKAVAWSAAILLSGFFEVGLRKFLPYSVRVFLYDRWTGLDRYMSYFILAVAGLLLIGSAVFSFKGSKELVAIVSEPTEIKTDQADNQHSTKIDGIKSQYLADKAATNETYGAQIAAIESKYGGLIAKQESEIALYERKEQRNKKSYTSRKQVHKGNISKLQAERGAQLADLQAAKRTDLNKLADHKNKASTKAQDSYSRTIEKIDRKNRTTKADATDKASLYGNGLGGFTIVCMIVLILSVTINEIHKKGSGIVETVIVSQYDFSPNFVSRFFSMAKEKFQQKVHSKITEWEGTTPAPTLPTLDHQLLDIGAIEQERISIEVEKTGDGKYIIPSRFDVRKSVNGVAPKLVYQFDEYSKNGGNFSQNMSTEEAVISATIKTPTEATPADKTDIGYNTTKKGKNQSKTRKNGLDNMGHIPDIREVQKLADQSKIKSTEMKRKKVLQFWNKYIKKHGRKPTYQIIADGIGMNSTKTIGKYVNYWKKKGEIK